MRGACPQCVRRCRLLGELGPLLDYRSVRRELLSELLGLAEEELIEVLGGRRRAALRAWIGRPDTGRMSAPAGGAQLCRHNSPYPPALGCASAPAVLTSMGGAGRLARLLEGPVVAFLDSAEASSYGRAMAASLSRGVAAAGVTVVAGLGGPIARAAHEGALCTGASLAIAGHGLASAPATAGTRGRLARNVLRAGCVVSELPWGCEGRRWGPIAAERIVAKLATVALLVEGLDEERELWAVRLAGVPGAVPGMITNPLAAGPHRLIAEGARLLRDASDVLELLHEAGTPAPAPTARSSEAALAPHLRRVLDLLGAGLETPEQLSAAVPAPARSGRNREWAAMAALGELEALGLATRSGEGRYIRRDPAPVGRL